MIRTTAQFININNVEIEVTIKAPYNEWKQLLEMIDGNRWPGSKFHEYIRDVLRKLERQVDIADTSKDI